MTFYKYLRLLQRNRTRSVLRYIRIYIKFQQIGFWVGVLKLLSQERIPTKVLTTNGKSQEIPLPFCREAIVVGPAREGIQKKPSVRRPLNLGNQIRLVIYVNEKSKGQNKFKCNNIAPRWPHLKEPCIVQSIQELLPTWVGILKPVMTLTYEIQAIDRFI